MLHGARKVCARKGDLLQRVGNGSSVRIWHDRWILGLVDGRVSKVKPIGCHLEFVNEPIEGGKCNKDLLQQWLNVDDVDHITNIPLSLYDRKDRLFWNFNKSGIYTVKTGYVVAKGKRKKRTKGYHLIWKPVGR